MKFNFSTSPINLATMGSIRQTVKFAQMKEKVESQSTPRYPGTYDNDPMNITTRTDWKKIVPVSDKVKEDLINAVRKSMEGTGGMGDENSPILKIKHKYLNSLSAKERLSAAWTLDQIIINEAQRLVDFVQAKDPKWTHGQPVKAEILAEAYKSPNVDIKA